MLIALKPYLAFVTDNNPVNHNQWSYIPLMGTQVNDRDICNRKSNFFYNNLVESKLKLNQPFAAFQKWDGIVDKANINYSNCFITRVKLIKDHKIAEFNYKFYHSILPCNKNLFKWRIKNSTFHNEITFREFL